MSSMSLVLLKKKLLTSLHKPSLICLCAMVLIICIIQGRQWCMKCVGTETDYRMKIFKTFGDFPRL